MPKRSRKPAADPNVAAFQVLQSVIESGEAEGKNPIAVAFGRLGGLKGGRARAEKMSSEERSESVLNRRASDRSVADLHQIGRLTLERLQSRPVLALFQRRTRSLEKVESATQRLVGLLQLVNPERWTEDQFAAVDHDLRDVISGLEQHFTKNVSQADTAHCQIIGAALQSLKDARGWLAQGLSPNQKLRPQTDMKQQQIAERAAEAYRALRLA